MQQYDNEQLDFLTAAMPSEVWTLSAEFSGRGSFVDGSHDCGSIACQTRPRSGSTFHSSRPDVAPVLPEGSLSAGGSGADPRSGGQFSLASVLPLRGPGSAAASDHVDLLAPSVGPGGHCRH